MPIDQVNVFWLSTGLGCDGCSIAVLGAMSPSVEETLLGTLPLVPKVNLYHPAIAPETGEDFVKYFRMAAEGKMDPYVVVLEGSVADERIASKTGGWFSALGADRVGDKVNPITTSEWLRRLAPNAVAVLAIGTCATYGGIPAAAGNATGAMGILDFLGKDFKSKLGISIVCVPGCAPIGDNFLETVAYLLLQVQGLAPPIELDEAHRPTWLFGRTVHENCPRAGFYEEGDFGTAYGTEKCLVKLGCWGPVVKCNVPQRGYINHIGGCPNVGGICIGCTMPGFPDKFAPFLTDPPGASVSIAVSERSGSLIREMRKLTIADKDKEVRWA
jgi:hydrogenase small subunit